MASVIRRLIDLLVPELLVQHKKLRLDLMKIKLGTIFHADASAAITTADATDLATLVVLANVIKASYVAHIASACSATTGQGAHIAADATNTVAAADATDLATAQTLLNEVKGDYNAHRILTASHPTADATNVVASANGSDLATNITLANEIKADLNAHYAAAMNHQAISDVAA